MTQAVRRRFAVADFQDKGAGTICAATLLAMAEAAIGGQGALTALSAQLAAPAPAGGASVEAIARPAETRGGLSAWQVELRDGTGRTLAHIALNALDAPERAPSVEAPALPAEAARDRRDHIARAASAVIADKGFAAATMREIAHAAGMHVPTVYQYVRSKEEVLELVYHYQIMRVRRNVSPVLCRPGPPLERLREGIAALVRNNGAMRREAGVMNRELRSLSSAARRRVLDDYAGLVAQLAAIIEGGIEEGTFAVGDATMHANMIDAICDIWALRPFANGSMDEAAFTALATRFALGGLTGEGVS